MKYGDENAEALTMTESREDEQGYDVSLDQYSQVVSDLDEPNQEAESVPSVPRETVAIPEMINVPDAKQNNRSKIPRTPKTPRQSNRSSTKRVKEIISNSKTENASNAVDDELKSPPRKQSNVSVSVSFTKDETREGSTPSTPRKVPITPSKVQLILEGFQKFKVINNQLAE